MLASMSCTSIRSAQSRMLFSPAIETKCFPAYAHAPRHRRASPAADLQRATPEIERARGRP